MQVAWFGESDNPKMEFVPKIDEINSTTKINYEKNYDEEALVEVLMAKTLDENQFSSSLKCSTETLIECFNTLN